MSRYKAAITLRGGFVATELRSSEDICRGSRRTAVDTDTSISVLSLIIDMHGIFQYEKNVYAENHFKRSIIDHVSIPAPFQCDAKRHPNPNFSNGPSFHLNAYDDLPLRCRPKPQDLQDKTPVQSRSDNAATVVCNHIQKSP